MVKAEPPPGGRGAETARAIALLETMIADQGKALGTEAPQQLERMKQLLAELRKGGTNAQAATLVRGLFTWQLERVRQEYSDRIRALAPAVAAGNGTALLTRDALLGMVAVANEALASMGRPGTPSTKALESVAARTRAALEEAAAAISLAAEPVVQPVRPQPGTPALAATQPRPFAAARPATSASVAKAPAPSTGFKAPISSTGYPTHKPRPKPKPTPGGPARKK